MPERAKSTKPGDLVAALKKTYLKQDLMVGMAVTFDERGDNTNADSAMVQILGGGVKVVLPAGGGSRKYIFPTPKQGSGERGCKKAPIFKHLPMPKRLRAGRPNPKQYLPRLRSGP